MKKYTIKYILSIIGVVLFAFAAVAIEMLPLEELGKPWVITVIFASCSACMSHIIASIIYDESKNTKSNTNISKASIGIIFSISTLCQIIYTVVSVVESCKKFGDIHPAEYFSAAMFMLVSAYAYKKASYKLIKKEKKDE